MDVIALDINICIINLWQPLERIYLFLLIKKQQREIRRKKSKNIMKVWDRELSKIVLK